MRSYFEFIPTLQKMLTKKKTDLKVTFKNNPG